MSACFSIVKIMVTLSSTVYYLPSWLPGMAFKRWAKEARKRFEDFVQVPFEKAIRDVNRFGMIIILATHFPNTGLTGHLILRF
jgi:hypothetical protein